MLCVKCLSGPFIDEKPVILADDGKHYCEDCLPNTAKNQKVVEEVNELMGAEVLKTPDKS